MEISLTNIACGYHSIDVLANVNLSFNSGELWCILGANGIGKTTLIKTLLGFIKPRTGEIYLGGRRMDSIGNKEMAQYISYVPQAQNGSLQYRVLDLVLMGRANHIRKFCQPTNKDYEIAQRVLDNLGIGNLANCWYSELSGGEQQVVLIARALAQESKFIIMDEPASNLDFENQKKILNVMMNLADKDVGIIMSSHSPDHAIYCNANVILIKKDKSIICGKAEEVITAENLKDGYAVDVEIICGMDMCGNPIRACRII